MFETWTTRVARASICLHRAQRCHSRNIHQACLSLILVLASVNFGWATHTAPPNEWSDIPYIQGAYSRIYFDYQPGQNQQPGTFYCINDWVVNYEGSINLDGLNSDEYNQFTFTLGSFSYDLRVFPDGSHELYRDGLRADDSLPGLETATGWNTSPNWDEPHTIWEFKFDVFPTQIGVFIERDPCNGAWPIYGAPDAPDFLTWDESAFLHVIDGAFSDTPSPSSPPLPSISRSSWLPEPDPWLEQGFNITLREGGGVEVEIIPEPASLIVWSLLALLGLTFEWRLGLRRRADR